MAEWGSGSLSLCQGNVKTESENAVAPANFLHLPLEF